MENSAKQKAVEMVDKFRPFSNATIGGVFYFNVETENAKQCALIDINHQIELNNKLSHMPKTYAIWLDTDTFLRQVRSEIEKL